VVTELTPQPPEHAALQLSLRSRGEQIADHLVTAIALGEYVEGQRLPTERELVALLGVSRKSARDAIHLLADRGYVEVRRGRSGGAYVTASWRPGSAERVRRTLMPRWEEFEDLFELRRVVEAMIARKAASRHDAGDAAALGRVLEGYRAAADREASRVADQALHAAVARATHNPSLERFSAELRTRVSLGFQAEPYSAELRRRALEQHAALVGAVLERDGEAAAEAAAVHFSLTEDALRSLRDRVRDGAEPPLSPPRP
jgi:GntR family transcriptional regulator, transcriptional repressor for pyruvate dehydrogenase complex